MTSPDWDSEWWRSSVTYQIYIRSFADSDGDGIGDVNGIRSRLAYIAALGVDALWINPWYPSPQVDAGYDVADYRDVEPIFGSLDDGRALITEAHAVGLRVLLDIVPNHTSDEHVWFQAALRVTARITRAGALIFRPGRGDNGERPPNAWVSEFGGSAWTRLDEADGEWYLHLFDAKQPDLNWDNPEVREEFLDILRFWFDAGVDGFRIDVAHGLLKEAGLPDLGQEFKPRLGQPPRPGHPHWDQAGVPDVYREWREVGDSYDPPPCVRRRGVGVVGRTAHRVPAAGATPYHVRLPHHTVPLAGSTTPRCNFPSRWRPIRRSARPSRGYSAITTSTGTSHATDGVRRHTRCTAYPRTQSIWSWGRDEQHAAILLELALPGAVYLYQGEELGLPEIDDIPEDMLADPVWERSGRTRRGRDGCRVPIPWTRSGPSLGFGDAQPWLPQPSNWSTMAVETEESDRSSMLWLYRDALRVRRQVAALHDEAFSWLDLGDDTLAFMRGDRFASSSTSVCSRLTCQRAGWCCRAFPSMAPSCRPTRQRGRVVVGADYHRLGGDHSAPRGVRCPFGRQG